MMNPKIVNLMRMITLSLAFSLFSNGFVVASGSQEVNQAGFANSKIQTFSNLKSLKDQLLTSRKKQGFEALQGEWIVDYEMTLEEARTEPALSPAEIEQIPSIIEQLMARLSLRIEDNHLIYSRDSREIVMSCLVEEVIDSKRIATCMNQTETIEVILTLIDEEYLNIRSSASNDLDYYIWKRKI